MRIHGRRWAPSLVTVLLVAGCGGPEDNGEEKISTGTTSSFIRAQEPIPGRYLVVLDDRAMDEVGIGVGTMRADLSSEYRANVTLTYQHAVRGFAAEMTEADAIELSRDPRVRWVEEDGMMYANAVQNGATWGLDRIDEVSLPLDGNYQYNDNAGAGVRAYIIDTGIRATHQEFASRVLAGRDLVDNDNNPDDCNGHGTHVAGTVAGTTFGVAKNANVIGVRVLDCAGSGTTAGVVAGIDWVTANAVRPAVANMSLGGGASATIDQAVQRSIAAGVVYAVAAGNETTDACSRSPARTPQAITVGSTTNTDARSSFSNFGTCVDIFAPGSAITSSWNTSNSATNTISGTSMATPHVAGAAALFLGVNPSSTPQQVRDALVGGGVTGVLTGVGTGSPNVLLNVTFIDSGTPPPPPPPPPPPAGSFTYNGSSTNSAQRRTTNQTIALTAGQTLTIGTCGVSGSSFSGDTWLRLRNPGNTQVASVDDSCGGVGSLITHTAVTSGSYQIRAGCFANTSCSGTVSWTIQ